MRKYNHRITGLITGMLAPMVILFGINTFNYPNFGFIDFLRDSWEFHTLTNWLKIAVLFNLVFFFFFMNINMLRAAQGVVFATIVYGLIIVYLTLT